MSEFVEPDWSALPDRPLEFFGLDEGFDRVALKRAYNRLLRHYKPEKFPNEFQRLRAAYEHLEEMLRYGGASAESTAFVPRPLLPTEPPPADRDAPESSSMDPGEGSPSPAHEPTSLPRDDTPPGLPPGLPPEPPPVAPLEIPRSIETEELPALRRTIREHPQKTPEDWVRLALLEEELLPTSPLRLYEVLIEAVMATEGSATAIHFLTEACRERVPAEHVPELLRMLAGMTTGSGRRPGVDPNWFYFLTEKLWTDHLEHAPFEEFAPLLEACRQEVGNDGFVGYTVLLVQVLRRGVLRVSDEWRDEALALLGDAFHQLPEHLQGDIHLYDWLDRYRRRRDEFLDAHPWRQVYDEALMKILAGDEVEADRAFLHAQVSALDDRDRLFAAFPVEGQLFDQKTIELDYAWEPLLWYADDVADRSDSLPAAHDPEKVAVRVTEFMRHLESSTDRTWLGRAWNLFGVVNLTLHIFAAFLPFGFVKQVPEDMQQYYVLGATVWASLCAASFLRHWFIRLFGNVQLFFARRLYARKWRDDVADFLANTHIPLHAMVHALAELQEDDITNDAYLHAALGQDDGLLFYSIALRFAG